MAQTKAEKAAKQKLWKAANPEKCREYSRRSHERNREKRNADHRAWNKANPERVRANNRRRHGVVDPPGETRHGVCPICTRTIGLVCDHWHNGPRKGQVRGWLCRGCNLLLGYAFDCGDNLDRAKAYLLADRSG